MPKAASRIYDTAISAAVGAVIALIISPLSLVLSYFLNDFLARPILSIEYAEISQVPDRIKLPSALLVNLVQSPGFQTHAMQNLAAGARLNTFMNREQISADERGRVEAVIAEYLEEFNLKNKMLKLLEDELGESPEDAAVEEVQKKYVQSVGALSPFLLPESDNKPTHKSLQTRIRSDLAALQKTIDLGGQLSESINKSRPDGTTVRIKAHILNKGNTDGLLLHFGSLILGNHEFPLIRIDRPAKSDNDAARMSVPVFVANQNETLRESSVGKVERNSMVEYWFIVDRAMLSEEETRKVEEISGANGMSFTVVLKDHARQPLTFSGNTQQLLR